MREGATAGTTSKILYLTHSTGDSVSEECPSSCRLVAIVS